MDFDLSKPQKLLQRSARELLARECDAARVRLAMESDTAHDVALWQTIADQGWLGLTVPENHGGLGLGVVELAAVAEEAGRVCMPGPFLSTIFAAAAIARMGTDEQQSRWLEPIVAGEMKATVAILESSADWNPDAIRSRISSNGTLSGEKHFVLDANAADVILCIVRDGDEFVAVPIEASRIALARTPSMDETRKVARFSLDGIAIEPRDVLRGSGLSAAIDVATVALCAEMVGGMQWILQTTVDYAKTRQQFGRVIGSFQAVQHQCADMLLFTESARSATYYAAWTLTHDPAAAPLAVSMAKAYCSDAYREVANRGIQVHGGIGFTWEHDLHLYYKRAKSSETLFGDATFHRERVASLVLPSLSNSIANDLQRATVPA